MIEILHKKYINKFKHAISVSNIIHLEWNKCKINGKEKMLTKVVKKFTRKLHLTPHAAWFNREEGFIKSISKKLGMMGADDNKNCK